MSLQTSAKMTVLRAAEEQLVRNYRSDHWYPVILLPGMKIAAMVKPFQRGNWYFDPSLLQRASCVTDYARHLQTLDFMTDPERGRRQVTYYTVIEECPAASARVQQNPGLGAGGAHQYFISDGHLQRIRRDMRCLHGSHERYPRYIARL